jgi:DNA-binding protein HU-beta
MPILTKSELVATVAEKTGESKAATGRFIDALQETIIDAVAEGKEVKLTGFAAFAPAIRSARIIKNPQTGADISVPETKVVKIRPLSVFRNTVNQD